MKIRTLCLLTVSLVSAVASLAAQTATEVPNPVAEQKFLLGIQRDYGRVRALLEDGKWKAADRSADRLFDDLVAAIVDDSDDWFGRVQLFRALASAGLQQDRRAAWNWNMAVHLMPALDGVALSKYGDAATRLAAIRTNQPTYQLEDLSAPISGEGLEVIAAPAGASELVPPRIAKSQPPKYPAGLWLAAVDEELTIEAIVETDGHLVDAVVTTEAVTPFRVSALDALRDWVYEPARSSGGEAVAVKVRFLVPFYLPQREQKRLSGGAEWSAGTIGN